MISFIAIVITVFILWTLILMSFDLILDDESKRELSKAISAKVLSLFK